ncbi:hypothetical protein AB0I10_27660 [Streptomyces sp. NPDC050636]|uniref:hypothetical protein n=1 Tax=Streptomyces sp. NPDC050636 TaxID=3154510 RepID=UPI00342772AF
MGEVADPEVAQVVVELVRVGDGVEGEGAVEEFAELGCGELRGCPVEGEAAGGVVGGPRGA